ncbi:DUF6266 family protein [Pedobacter faecalis]|uniref:DUF6266 family protein n=1 Tax=Pedobacter faecalis TaxID=3041495 RepID=UPI00254F1C65|nr:DUF6266 family protein [Pedobacter sp. ELA7]
MGIQIWGAFGGFQKKTGALVGRRVNGQNVITAIPHPSELPPSEGQLSFRARFKLVVSFQKWITPLIRTGFRNAHKEKQNAFNAAFVYNYRNAVTGSGLNWTIDYPKFMYSSGMLGNAAGLEMQVNTDAQLDFSWTAVPDTGVGAASDKASFVVYNPAQDKFVVRADAALRSALTYDLAVPVNFSGDTVHVWMNFVSADGKTASNTLYVGSAVVM